MDDIILMTSLAIFLILAAVCSIIFNKIRMPSLIGYLVAGFIVTNVWAVPEDIESVVDILSKMGMVLLMFCIGMEINLKKLRKQGMTAMRVTIVAMPLMVLGGTVAGILLGMNSTQSICLGALISGSSTAVVLGVLNLQNRLDKDHIDTLILVTIMEDIGQVMILSMITPLMAGSELDTGGMAALILSILVFMSVSILVGLRFMPRIINWVSDNVPSEVLVILALGLTFGMALLSSFVGLSMAIGAFLMGMMIAPSRKNKEILHSIEPMKNVFMAMFFISVGMEIGLDTLTDNLGLTFIILIVFIVLKTVSGFLGYWLADESPRDSFACAVSFLAMGEFAFIISKQALEYHVFTEGMYASVISAALLSMIVLPMISKDAAERWDWTVQRIPGRILSSLRSVDNAKTSFYDRIDQTSKRTRKEISGSATMSYIGLIVIVITELVFALATSPLVNWGVQYFGGSVLVWSILILMINLIVLYIPTLWIVDSIKNILIATHTRDPDGNSRREHNFLDSLLVSNSWLIALMIAITILIIVPNGLEFWEHIVVLLIALVVLLYINRRTISSKADLGSDEDDGPDHMDEESFRELLKKKYAERLEEEGKKTASIDTGERRRRFFPGRPLT